MAFVVIEFNNLQVDHFKGLAMPLVYGDAGQTLVLEAAGIENARLLIITTPSAITTRAIAEQGLQMNGKLHVLARSSGRDHMKILRKIGVHGVVQPEFEAGLEITRQALLAMDISDREIRHLTDQVRQELYAPLYQDENELLSQGWPEDTQER
jgi:CPA2 family monovalent cation:H+ antiporter-2